MPARYAANHRRPATSGPCEARAAFPQEAGTPYVPRIPVTGCANTHAGAPVAFTVGRKPGRSPPGGEGKLIVQSSLDWTIMRPPRLGNGAATGEFHHGDGIRAGQHPALRPGLPRPCSVYCAMNSQPSAALGQVLEGHLKRNYINN